MTSEERLNLLTKEESLSALVSGLEAHTLPFHFWTRSERTTSREFSSYKGLVENIGYHVYDLGKDRCLVWRSIVNERWND